jgi:hypothetical protein
LGQQWPQVRNLRYINKKNGIMKLKLNSFFIKKQENDIKNVRQLLKAYNISYIKFIIYYLFIMSNAVKIFWKDYFKYFMMIIWRRTLLVWTFIITLIYENFFKEVYNWIIRNIIYIKNIYINFIGDHGLITNILLSIISTIIFIIFAWNMFKLLRRIYNFLFIYRELITFNDKIKRYYTESLLSFFKKHEHENNKGVKDVYQINREKQKNKEHKRPNNLRYINKRGLYFLWQQKL